MDIKDFKNVWVYVESIQGKAKNVSLELINEGNALAEKTTEKLVAIVIGKEVEEVAKEAIAYGADEAILVEGEEYQEYNTDGYTNVMANLIEKYKPSVILLGATNNGKDLAARVACRVKTGLVADCSDLEVDSESKEITWTRPIMSGRALSKVTCRTRPQMGTVRQGAFDKTQADNSKPVNIIREEIRTSAKEIRTKLVDFVNSGVTGMKLEDAEVIVSGGAGLGKAEGFALLQELADELGGAVGASRACIDAEWIPANCQVGQSGKTVSPKLYIACGISGAIQHLAGMSSSKVIVAINKDPDAQFFEIADYCVVGDLYEVVPALLDEINKHKAR
ncbi:electron transfer flavoprotein subunit alpha/FixB family protein [Desulfitobacterium sp. Sab5]|uniref:electron transfer flavoprotein subunit alpha/FixB family protein n=1 Tax=Desulfitobacterium nosdiversum TaxID=3375356 RepID=UPI003CF23E7E